MGSSSSRRRSRVEDGGFATVQLVLASGLSLLLFASLANVLIDLYARAAVQAAVEEGAHAMLAGRGDSDACEHRARDALADLLPGPIGDEVQVTCTVDHGRVVVAGTGTLRGWGLVPDWELRVVVEAVLER